MTQAHHFQRTRIPKGTVTGGVIPLRISLEERAIIEAMAAEQCRTASNMARLVFLRGLEAIQPDQYTEAVVNHE